MKETLSDYLMIGQKIQKARKNKALTQIELAEKTGIGYRTIQKYESNDVNPKIRNLKKIANILEVDFNSFFEIPNDYYDLKELAFEYLQLKLKLQKLKLKPISKELKKIIKKLDLMIELFEEEEWTS